MIALSRYRWSVWRDHALVCGRFGVIPKHLGHLRAISNVALPATMNLIYDAMNCCAYWEGG